MSHTCIFHATHIYESRRILDCNTGGSAVAVAAIPQRLRRAPQKRCNIKKLPQHQKRCNITKTPQRQKESAT